MFFVALTFLIVWLPLIRCLFDGKSYSWGQKYFGIQLYSEGLSTDYLWLVLFFAFYILLFSSFYWIRRRLIFYSALLAWWMHSFGSLLFDIIKNGDTEFHGDTLNVHVSLTAVVVPLSIVLMALLGWVINKDRKMPEGNMKWGRRNRMWAILLLAPLVIQAILLATGEPHGTTDEIGVIMAIAQALLFPMIFIPSKGEGN